MEQIDGLPDGVLGLRCSGQVTRDDYARVALPVLQEGVASESGVRLLVVLDGELDELEPGAIWEDLKFGLGPGAWHHSRFTRVALVSDEDWARRMVGTFGWMMPGEVDVYGSDECNDAIAWVAG